MKKIILIRYGEIMLKGLNRPAFEAKLMSNIRKSLYDLGKVHVRKSQARIFVEPQSDDYDFNSALERLSKIFGIISVSPVWKIDSNYEEIKEHSLEMLKDIVDRKTAGSMDGERTVTFKVETKRANKRFPMQSPEISAKLGEFLLDSIPVLKVDVKNPSIILFVEIRESTYIYSEILPANGGLPVGINGKVMLLLSGGIDSPVAAWMMAKRGVTIEAVHFHSYPYTSERAKEKVIELAKILSDYCFDIKLHIVPFTDIQLEINEKCPHEELTIIMRRIMMIIAEKIARAGGALALVTGESLGQVASQTIESLYVTDAAVQMPVFRPLIGMDKNEVINIARKINTYETSILPYEDCCTVFVAKHPKTKPRLDDILKSELVLDIEEMVDAAIKNTEVLTITSGKKY